MVFKIDEIRKKLICTLNIYKEHSNIKILFSSLTHKIIIEEHPSFVFFIFGPLLSVFDIYVYVTAFMQFNII